MVEVLEEALQRLSEAMERSAWRKRRNREFEVALRRYPLNPTSITCAYLYMYPDYVECLEAMQ